MNAVYSVHDEGLASGLVEVQTHLSNGLPTIQIIGAVGKSLDEAKDRIRSAFSSASLELPRKKITINITPSDLPKDGSHFDLALVLSILLESKKIPALSPKTIVLGEVGLDGTIRPIRGLLGKMLIAKEAGFNSFIVPLKNAEQARLIPGVKVALADNMKSVVRDLSGDNGIHFTSTESGAEITSSEKNDSIDFADVIGQDLAKRALEIAAAGQHNVLLSGPPGVGKSMLAKALISIMPPLSRDEVIQITHLHSLVGGNSHLMTHRPIRSPHHSSSDIAIIGGGQRPKPGEITLSHKGILFLDELPEFKRSTIESLRQPLEDKEVTVSRAKQSVRYPADFLLIATKNPCPCGYYGSSKPCICSPIEIDRYQKKLSGPLLDRIDLHVTVDSVDHAALLEKNKKTPSETSKTVRARVYKTVQVQEKRFENPLKRNGEMSNKEIKQFAQLSDEAKAFLDKAAASLDLSARVYMKTVKVARTIADLDDSEIISLKHITEAIHYRPVTTS